MYLLIDGVMVSKLSVLLMKEAIITFLAFFYLLDIPYTKQLEIPITILQSVVFADTTTTGDLLPVANKYWGEYQEFINQ